jgi:hypothetical protein
MANFAGGFWLLSVHVKGGGGDGDCALHEPLVRVFGCAAKDVQHDCCGEHRRNCVVREGGHHVEDG